MFLQSSSALSNSVKEVLTLTDDGNLFESCVLCRRPIPQERLQQMPWAASCASCDSETPSQDLCFELAPAA